MRKMEAGYGRASSVATVTTYIRDTFNTSTSTMTQPEYADLPEHLQISYELDKNPWENLFMQDFIMVAEFSEHEGPRPLVRALAYYSFRLHLNVS